MINLKKQAWRTGALCLAGVVALSVTGVSVYAKTSEKKETEVKEQIRDAVDDIWKSEDTSAASIDETVYVILNADGTQQKIYVSDWLKNQGEKDSYTQSNPDKDAPISLKVTYTLDGKEISPSDLNSQSGHVVIRYDYTNELYETREIAGKEEKIYVPFAVMTGMILDNDNFSNIKVSSGKVINDGSHSVVTGIVFPGLGTNLDMEEDFDDYLEIEADATDFTMNESYCIATNSVFSRLDFSNVDDLDDLTEAMADLELETHKICIVSDSNVGPLYAETVKAELEKICSVCEIFTFPAGEENKNLEVVQKLYTFLIEQHFDRKDLLVALGGGVVGDLTGFTAATYLRGIRFIQIPTTLLAQVDSSIGGKTGVDFSRYKNMVGAFYMPKLVYMNLQTLSTLPERQFYAGMGEVLKSALIKDGMFYGWIINSLYEIYDKDPETIRLMIYNCCNIKRMVVEKDPTEQGDRALLNLGHTIGHAVEKAKNFELLHGECVALGIVAAAFISYKREMLTFDEYYEIRDMFVPFNLPITIEDVDPEEILKLTKSDKKMEAGRIKFILLKKIGKAVIDHTVTDEELRMGIHEIYVSDEDKYE